MKNCIICQKELVKQQVKFCSQNCKQKAHYSDKKPNTNSTYSQFKRADIRKREFIELRGGCCCKCGYNKNFAALHFHHLDEKNFSLDIRTIGNSSKEKLLKELELCILICANCHAELHYPHCEINPVQG